MKHIKTFTIQFSPTRKFDIDFYEKQGYFYMTIWYCRRLKDIVGYENEWGTNWWQHFKLWERR